MLPFLGRHYRPGKMEAGGQRHVDGVNIGVVEYIFVVAVRRYGGRVESVVGDEAAGLVVGAAAHGDEGGVGGDLNGARELPGDLRAAHDAKARRRRVWGWRRRCGRRG